MRHLHPGLDRRAGDERVQLAPAQGGGPLELRRHSSREELEGRRRLRGPRLLRQGLPAPRYPGAARGRPRRQARRRRHLQDRPRLAVAQRLLRVLGDAQGARRHPRLRHAALRYLRLERHADAQHPTQVRAVRARADARAHHVQDDGPCREGPPERRERPAQARLRQADADADAQCRRGADRAVLLPADDRDALALHGRPRGQRPRLPSKLRLVRRRDGAEQRIRGKRFDEEDVKAVVRNPIYKGIIRYGGKLYPARHEPIIDPDTWEQANRAYGNGREDDDGLHYRDDHVHLLKGARLVELLPLADQKERTSLYQLPEAQLVNQTGPSSGNRPNGSSARIRTSNLAVNSRPLYR